MAKTRKSRALNFIDYPSPNFDERNGEAVEFLVLHYTGIETLEGSLERLTSKNAPRVSAHYVEAEDGRAFRLVSEDKRAWHAGVSFWNGKTDLNSKSVGIEIQNAGDLHSPPPPFPQAQMDSVLALCQQIVRRHNIRAFNVVAHSDIAPDRKQDPGEVFPWAWLAQQGIGVWPKPLKQDYDASANWKDDDVLKRLRQYGYNPNLGLKVTLTAFQRHFHQEVFATPEKVGIADAQSKARLAALLRSKTKADKAIATRKKNAEKRMRRRK